MPLEDPQSSIQQTLRNINPTVIAVLGGLVCAAFSLVPLSFSILALILNYFSSLPLYLVAFGWGWQKGARACFVTFLIFLVSLGVSASFALSVTTLIPVLTISAAFLHRVSASKDGSEEMEWYPARYSISWITGCALVLFLGFTAYLMTKYATPEEAIKEWFSALEKQTYIKDVNAKLMGVFPGIIAVSWIVMNLVNAAIAQRILQKYVLNIRPYPGLRDRLLHQNWDIILICGVMLELTDHPLFAFIGTNVAVISCVPLYLLGLSVVRTWLNQVEEARIWIFCIVVLSFLLVWPGLIVVLLGVLEPSLKLSQRFTKKI